MSAVYLLGGAQTDFARNWNREGLDIYSMFREVMEAAVTDANIDPARIEVGHVGNFVADLFCGQGLMGGFFAHVFPELNGIPTSRHEAACASGSIAMLSAMRDIEAGHYDVACVLGIELMRNVDGKTGAEHLGAAVWHGEEATDCDYPWPFLFDRISAEYEQRHGLKHEHLARIAEVNFANAKRNPHAQSRDWLFPSGCFSEDDKLNPVIEGRVRKLDCGQITDGAACVLLVSEKVAKEHAQKNGIQLSDMPKIKGWGHRSAPLLLEQKLKLSEGQPLLFPHAAATITDALRRADVAQINSLDGLETHDCFTITEYMALDHCGLTAPGESWKAVEEGTIEADGAFPVNASGGLIGLGHPVGATGVRMALDCARQVTGKAGAAQISGAQNMITFNLGGSTTTCASLIVGVGD
ncbi:acetyl-CoA acetyltransferase [Congregibacter brevis]|uniref:Acetyl-CoA acetyltransferase n=1 Tax=Congregibacter brevis TaxID=3081201 RepID=A0ABZ0IDD6_9GAMM|nr:acetyl-CoA acetyltransferase [Congregibacter sp. IMCC45268]